MDWLLGSRNYYVIALIIILFSLLLFGAMFEKKRPKTGEVVMISIMITLAVTGRIIFFMTPQLKPMASIIIIAAIAFGKEAGFLCGALSLFITNIFYGQGPWTPWQMFAFGVIGYLMGAIFNRRFSESKITKRKILEVSVAGGFAVFIIYGLIIDTSNALLYTDNISLEVLLASYATGTIYNGIHAISTVIFLAILTGPLLRKINRVKIKYGMFMEHANNKITIKKLK